MGPTRQASPSPPRDEVAASPSLTPWAVLAGMLGVAGVAHWAIPHVYDPLIPTVLGPPRPWVLVSGAAQIGCAAAIAAPRTRRRGAYAGAMLFVAIFPGNVWMALESGERSHRYQALVWGRLPLQVPLVLWAVHVARTARARPPARDASAADPPGEHRLVAGQDVREA